MLHYWLHALLIKEHETSFLTSTQVSANSIRPKTLLIEYVTLQYNYHRHFKVCAERTNVPWILSFLHAFSYISFSLTRILDTNHNAPSMSIYSKAYSTICFLFLVYFLLFLHLASYPIFCFMLPEIKINKFRRRQEIIVDKMVAKEKKTKGKRKNQETKIAL